MTNALIDKLNQLPTTGPGWDQKVRAECIQALWTQFGDVSKGNQTLWFAEFSKQLLKLHAIR